MAKLILIISGLSGALAVILGAFAAHGLKRKLSAEMLSAFKTGVDYQFYHTFALAMVGLSMLVQDIERSTYLGCGIPGTVYKLQANWHEISILSLIFPLNAHRTTRTSRRQKTPLLSSGSYELKNEYI